MKIKWLPLPILPDTLTEIPFGMYSRKNNYPDMDEMFYSYTRSSSNRSNYGYNNYSGQPLYTNNSTSSYNSMSGGTVWQSAGNSSIHLRM